MSQCNNRVQIIASLLFRALFRRFLSPFGVRVRIRRCHGARSFPQIISLPWFANAEVNVVFPSVEITTCCIDEDVSILHSVKLAEWTS